MNTRINAMNDNQAIKIFHGRFKLEAIKAIALETFGDMAKAVVDVERKIIAVGGELHADAEAVLLADGSRSADLWGINLYPAQPKDKLIVYDSLINIRPSLNQRSQTIADPTLRDKIKAVVFDLLEKI